MIGWRCVVADMKRLKSAFVLIMLVIIASACSKTEEIVSEYNLYYVNKEETKIVKVPYEPVGESTDELVKEFISLLDEAPDDLSLKKAKPDNVLITNYSVDARQVYLTFNKKYHEMSPITEILFRASVVRTLTQIPGIEYVSFYINDQPLTDSNGNVVGIMTASNFIENTGQEINSYERTKLVLYYANKAGDKLIETSVDVVYSTNISVEKLVVEKLIKGPSSKSVYPTIPPKTKLLSVTIQEGVCYVNFDEGFLENQYDVSEAVPVYSVVNSLLELSNINKVQILINGKTNITYREAINFETMFERNLDIIETNSTITEEEEGIINE